MSTKVTFVQNRQEEFSGAEPVREGFELDISSLQAYMEEMEKQQ
jgi:hypothetical protein